MSTETLILNFQVRFTQASQHACSYELVIAIHSYRGLIEVYYIINSVGILSEDQQDTNDQENKNPWIMAQFC